MTLLDIIRRHRPEGLSSLSSQVRDPEPSPEGLDSNGQGGNLQGVNSLSSLSSHSQEPTPAELCAEWCYRYIRGRYPRLVSVIEAAHSAGFDAGIVIATLEGDRFVQYEMFGSDIIKIRTVDDTPDDPCIRAWCRMDSDLDKPAYVSKMFLG